MVGDVKQFSALKDRMLFLQMRQKVLAENVANADTPDYKPKDVVMLGASAASSHSGAAAQALPMAGGGYSGGVAPVVTNSRHITGSAGGYTIQDAGGARYGTRPSGNSVSLEDEVLKVSQNQIDFQMAAGLYQRGFSTLKIALGRKA